MVSLAREKEAGRPSREAEVSEEADGAGMTVAILMERIKAQRREHDRVFQAILDKRTNLIGQVREIEDLLGEQVRQIDELLHEISPLVKEEDKGNGEDDGEPVTSVSVVPSVEASKSGKVGRKNEFTIIGGIERLLKDLYPDGLSRADIVGKLISEIGYRPREETSPEDFANSVYTSGINKMMLAKVVFSRGKRGNKIYIHKDHFSKDE